MTGLWRAVSWVVLVGWSSGGCRAGLRQQEQQEKEGAATPTLISLEGETVVALDSATVQRIGLRTVTLARASRPPEIQLAAVVTGDPGATTTVRPGVGGRLSELPGRPWPRIGERLVAGTEIIQVGDARPLLVPRGGTVSRLLAQPGELVQAGQGLLELVDYSRPLVRVTWTPDAPAPPASLSFAPFADNHRAQGHLQGPAPEADPVTGGPAYLYRLSAPGTTLRPGAVLIAFLPDPRSRAGGVEVPSPAVVQWEALAWVYVERAPGRFARVRVATEHPVPGGWRVDHGLNAGDRVVTVGAGQLLSEEFRARIVVGEEVGE
ncbi:MAG TPA: HlyD family efflux transporter periplasmic adaptor subunit [Gemmatimonadales bacterium]